MKQALQLIVADCKRAIFSIGFFISVIGIWAVFFRGAKSVMAGTPDILSLVQYPSGSNSLVLLFCVLPYTMSFCSDWDSKYIRLIAARTGFLKYAISKYIACFFSSCLAMVVGMLLFILPFTATVPLVTSNPDDLIVNITLPTLQGQLLGQGRFLLYFVVYIFLRSLHNGFWATVGLCASAYIPNRFVAVFIPYIGYFALSLLTYQFPTWLQLSKLGTANFMLSGVAVDILYAIFFFVMLLFAVGFLFVRTVKRRASNA